MFLRCEGKGGQGAPAADFHILCLVRAIGHIVGGNVRQAGQQVVQPGGQVAILVLQRGQGLLQFGDFGLQRLGPVLVALAHGLADQLRCLVTAGLRFLHAGADLAPASVHFQQRGGARLHPAPGEGGIESVRIVADQADVMHGRAYGMIGRARSSARCPRRRSAGPGLAFSACGRSKCRRGNRPDSGGSAR